MTIDVSSVKPPFALTIELKFPNTHQHSTVIADGNLGVFACIESNSTSEMLVFALSLLRDINCYVLVLSRSVSRFMKALSLVRFCLILHIGVATYCFHFSFCRCCFRLRVLDDLLPVLLHQVSNANRNLHSYMEENA